MEFWNEDTQEFKTRPLVLQISRNLTAFMTFLIELIREVLLGGLETIVAFTSWDWIDKNPLGRITWSTMDNCCCWICYSILQIKWKRACAFRRINHGLYICLWTVETIHANSFFYISCGSIIIYIWIKLRDCGIQK